MSATSKSRAASAPIAQILAVYGILAAGAAGLVLLGFMPAAAIDPHALTRPMFAQFALTVLVWIALPIARNWAVDTTFTPSRPSAAMAGCKRGWERAVERAKRWEIPD